MLLSVILGVSERTNWYKEFPIIHIDPAPPTTFKFYYSENIYKFR